MHARLVQNRLISDVHAPASTNWEHRQGDQPARHSTPFASFAALQHRPRQTRRESLEHLGSWMRHSFLAGRRHLVLPPRGAHRIGKALSPAAAIREAADLPSRPALTIRLHSPLELVAVHHFYRPACPWRRDTQQAELQPIPLRAGFCLLRLGFLALRHAVVLHTRRGCSPRPAQEIAYLPSALSAKTLVP